MAEHRLEVTSAVLPTGAVAAGWAAFEDATEVAVWCSCGLMVSGPREPVARLVQAHTEAVSADG